MREGAPSLSEALDAYLDDLAICRSRGTARTYRSLLRHLRPHEALTPALCRRVIRDVMARRSSATAETTWSALASFSRWLVDQRYYAESPMRGVPVPKRIPPAHRFLSHTELLIVYGACKDDRERLIVRLLTNGLRAGQLLALRWSDLRGDVLLIRPHKRNPAHAIALDAEALRLLEVAIPRFPENGAKVFAFGYDRLRQIVGAIGRRARIPLHAHLLRHSWASNWMLEVGDAATLQQLGGWTSQKMITGVYARSAMAEAALRKSRQADLTHRLLDERPENPAR